MATAIQRSRVKQLKYARQRESERLLWIHTQDRNVIQDVNRQLKYAMEQCLKESESWITRYAMKEKISTADALKLASSADIKALAEKAKIYVPAKDFSDIANSEMRLYNFSMRMSRHELLLRNMDLETLRAYGNVNGTLSSYLGEMSLAELRRQAGILGLSVGDMEDMEALARQIANSGFQGAHFSDRIWQNQSELLKRLDAGITKSMLMGKHPTTWMREMRHNLTEAFNGSAYAMKRLAVTESARVQIASQKAAYEAGGYDWFEFIAEPSACEICRALDGKIAPVKTMMFGGNAPPIHPNCKCSTAASMGPDEEKKAKESSIIEPENKMMFPDELAGVKRGEPMDPQRANSGNPNPHFLDAYGYRVNCQSCVVTYEARLRGYDVSTLPKGAAGDQLSRKTNLAWIDPASKTHPEYIFDETATTAKRLYKFLDDTLDPEGRYTIEFAWKGRRNSGHIVSLSKNPEGGLNLYDPQSGKHYHNKEVEAYFGNLKLKFRVPALNVTVPLPAKVLRVDDKEFNLGIVNQIMEEFGK
ncbi:minor capsid protein [Proteiniclasticum sp. QWL-01]|uniref:minor capsid protein n=1 Tax=Proteiniclasticum sp. QWL-01 TaxID=3036945 RepID=UPI0024112446|nr:minor capsid protein [Proteiniclasticum sp. QWL-01]WFF74011.1 minor capsid protein [Proteiniclasticum sp. QWL-01]